MPGRSVPRKEFRALSGQNVETVASVVCCNVGPLWLFPQDVCALLRKEGLGRGEAPASRRLA